MKVFEALRGGLIVSVQVWRGSALDDPQIIAAMREPRKTEGPLPSASEGVENLLACAGVALPIVGWSNANIPDSRPTFRRRSRRWNRSSAPAPKSWPSMQPLAAAGRQPAHRHDPGGPRSRRLQWRIALLRKTG